MESGYNRTNDRRVALEREVGKMKNDMRQRQFNDSLVTASIREELDIIANKKKEDRLIISEMTNKAPTPTTKPSGGANAQKGTSYMK
jgi:hypothetical protein